MVERYRTKLNGNGRMVIPAALRRELGLKVGDELMLRSEDGELRVYTLANAVRQAQEMVRRYTRGGGSAELIRERREEVKRELGIGPRAARAARR